MVNWNDRSPVSKYLRLNLIGTILTFKGINMDILQKKKPFFILVALIDIALVLQRTSHSCGYAIPKIKLLKYKTAYIGTDRATLKPSAQLLAKRTFQLKPFVAHCAH